MEVIIIQRPTDPLPVVRLIEDSNDALGIYCSSAESLGVEYEFDAVANTDNQVDELIHEVDRQLEGTGITIHWFEVEPLWWEEDR